MMHLFAVLAGGMVVMSMVMNARIARSLGVFQGALINFAVGLLASAVLVGVCIAFDYLPAQADASAPPWYAYSGALLGIAIVASCNVVIPRISVVYSAVLIFLGQILTGLLLDAAMAGGFDAYKALGALLVASGLLVNARIDAQAEAALRTEPLIAVDARPAALCTGPGSNG